MNRMIKYGTGAFFATLLLVGCDEGNIYPDNSVDMGKVVNIHVTFKGVKAYPTYNMLTLAAFGEDDEEPLLVQRLSRPSEGQREELTMMGLPSGTKSISVAIVARGNALIYKFFSKELDLSSGDEINLPETTIDLSCYGRVQSQIFDARCTTCHGATSTSPAGNLFLTSGKSHAALVNVPAVVSVAQGKNYVTPEEPDNSFLTDILFTDISQGMKFQHSDIFSGSEATEASTLLNAWINNGANE